MDYRRAYQKGGCYFFTVVTQARRPLLTQPDTLVRLREAFRRVRWKMPFQTDAIVILPDHLHCVWRLPPGDDDFSGRWKRIKHYVSVILPTGEVSASRQAKREKAVWQRRFWEHLLRDEEDWRRHMDYVHYNPVKHGYVGRPVEWLFGSFPKAVKMGWYDENWGAEEPTSVRGMDYE